MMKTLELFGKRIKELRKQHKITQEKLAELIGVEPQQICRIEKGSCFTTMETLEKFSKVFDVNIAELFKFSHLSTKENLILKINELFENADEEQIKLIYRIVTDILQ